MTWRVGAAIIRNTMRDPACAGALIRDRSGRVFVQRRSPSRRAFPGIWDIVGGHIEAGETIEEALAREIKEETGWELRRIGPRIADWQWEHDGVVRRELDYLVEVDGDLAKPELEAGKHDAFAWVGMQDLELLMEGRTDGDTRLRDIVARALAQPEEAAGRRVLRLLAVERGLQDEGQGNAAKLFRAAALGEALRTTRVHPRLGRGLEHEVTDLVAELRAVGREELAGLMVEALAIVGAGGWPTLAQIPSTFVCRDCGEVMLGQPPATCPVCRARVVTFYEIGPFYWELLDVDHVLPELTGSVAEVEAICAGVTEAQAQRGPWSMHDIVAHLLGGERLSVVRAVRILEEDDPELAVVTWTDTVADEPADLADLVARLREQRERTLTRFGALTPEQWQRAGRHPEWGRLTVQRLLSQAARHERSHLAELEARREGR